jgi:large subunit ribosomal protein L10
MGVKAMNELRRSMRESDVVLRVVKNRLTYIAADEADSPLIKEIVEGPTVLAFGFEDPVAPAKALAQFIRNNRTGLTIRGGVLGDRRLSKDEVDRLAALLPKDELIARLMGQMLAPITALAFVLAAPAAGLARVLQRIVEEKREDEQASAEGALPEEGAEKGAEESAEAKTQTEEG